MNDLQVLEIMRRGIHKISCDLSTEDLRASMLWLEIVENNIKRAQEESKEQERNDPGVPNKDKETHKEKEEQKQPEKENEDDLDYPSNKPQNVQWKEDAAQL